ncbi:membrane protein insertion efficiency factor YidD [Paenibacillus ginsengihumi]|uniref:membrane protein insertion efficiency factor YidD n=1 Tax=Paenibacillus ginsengihumi TaxID=431596 RepID=UPI0003685733|nr:membrane protein insertion efficiency factor YidD [Paenibacillus ginsengihumi]
MKKLLQLPVKVYRRWISPLKPPTCRFYPTCSAYALEALEKHGAARGTWLAVKRIAKCHPFHPGGIDHVPDAPGRRSKADGRG